MSRYNRKEVFRQDGWTTDGFFMVKTALEKRYTKKIHTAERKLDTRVSLNDLVDHFSTNDVTELIYLKEIMIKTFKQEIKTTIFIFMYT